MEFRRCERGGSLGLMRASEEGDPSAFVTTSTFTDFWFIAKYGTSDRVPLLAVLVHLDSATLDFRQSGWSELQSTLRYAQRNKKPKKGGIIEIRAKRFTSGLTLDEKVRVRQCPK